MELDEKGRQTARNIHGINPISRTIEGETAYYMYNGHADVTALVSESGTILGTYYYDAFGNPTETTGTADNPFRYSAYQYDNESGLYYVNSRMYDPRTARFLQEDSYRGDFNDPLSLNLYTYCHNEPIMYWDPTGHRRENEGYLNRESGIKKTTSTTINKTSKKVNTRRIEQGVNKAVNGGILIAIGGIALASAITVFTGGAGAPLLVAAIASATAIAGGATMVMGAADVFEGEQDIVYGALGSEKKPTNLIKDYVFEGNEEAYGFAEGMTAALATAGAAYLAYAPEIQNSTSKVVSAEESALEKSIKSASEEKIISTEEVTLIINKNTSKTASSTLEISEAVSGDNLGNMFKEANKANSAVVDEYGILKNDKSIPGLAHHLNQNAAYRDVIPPEKGMSVKLEGNAFTQPGTQHYEAHASMEEFWNQFRQGGERYGEMPTNLEYSKALLDSLRNAGYSTKEALAITRQAIKQRVDYGLYGGEAVPRIPGRINQVK